MDLTALTSFSWHTWRRSVPQALTQRNILQRLVSVSPEAGRQCESHSRAGAGIRGKRAQRAAFHFRVHGTGRGTISAVSMGSKDALEQDKWSTFNTASSFLFEKRLESIQVLFYRPQEETMAKPPQGTD